MQKYFGESEISSLRKTYRHLWLLLNLLVINLTLLGCQPPFPDVEPAWITYTNQEYGYEFKYPGEARVEVTIKDASQVKVHVGAGEPFQVIVRIDYSPADVLYYLDTSAIGERKIGANLWSEFMLPDGYCDATVCSPPLYALQMESGDILFTVTFYSQKTTTELQEEILGTFRVLDKR